MDISITENYFKEIKRACDLHRYNNNSGFCCGDCPVSASCFGYIEDTKDIDLKPLQKWSDEHPPKTRQSQFLEYYPNASLIQENGVSYLNICPLNIEETNCRLSGCGKCRKEYWLEEI